MENDANVASDEKKSILSPSKFDVQENQYVVENQGCVSKISQGWIAVIFTILASIGVISYSLSISIVVTGQTYIKSGAYTVAVWGSLWPCVLYIIIAILIKLGSKINITSTETCNVGFKHEHPYLIVAAGCINVSAFLLKLFGGLPERTPKHLQIILFAITLPAAIFWRYVISRKVVSKFQMVCVVAATLGILVSLVPVVAGDKTGGSTGDATWVSHLVWPVMTTVAHLCSALDFIVIEMILDAKKPSPLVVTFYIKLTTLVVTLAIFWVDLIPGVGFSSSLKEMGEEISRTWTCLWTTNGTCSVAIWRLWLFAFASAINFLSKISTIGYVQGPIYFGLIYCIPIPVGTLFWMLFVDEGGYVMWSPHFDNKSLFAVIGLCLIIPATVVFYFLGIRQQRNQSEEKYEELKD